jgi:hypothetical protein
MRTILLAAVLSLSAVAGCSKSEPSQPAARAEAQPAPAEPAPAQLPSMTIDEVERGLAAKQLQAVDCNPDDLRAQEGVLPGAIRLTSYDHYAASELPADKTAKLVFYCASPA